MKEAFDFNKFLNPKSVALIGASEIEGKVGGILLKKLMKSKIKVIPVNPKHTEIAGLRCYNKISDYPGQIDLAVIAIPALFVADALEECGKKGVKNIILISAGFSEIGNIRGEEQLVSIAKKYGMRILGPNCFGVCNPQKKFDTTFSVSMPEKGNIAFISQSGALWSFISDFSISGRFGFSGFVSLGNMADLEFNEALDFFLKDKKTKSIVLYVEKLKNGKKFLQICKKSKKKIYAIKAGGTEIGREATFSHTASLASDYRIYKGMFKQAGVVLCPTCEEAFALASGKELGFTKISNIKIGKRVFILTNAGGAGALMSDYLAEKGFEVVNKPLDILGTASGSDYFNSLEKLKKNETFDSIIVVLTPQSMSEVKKTAEVIVNFKNQTGRSVVPLFLGGKSMSEANKIFQEAKIDYFNTLKEAKEGLIF
jgi:acetyltransferase